MKSKKLVIYNEDADGGGLRFRVEESEKWTIPPSKIFILPVREANRLLSLQQKTDNYNDALQVAIKLVLEGKLQ